MHRKLYLEMWDQGNWHRISNLSYATEHMTIDATYSFAVSYQQALEYNIGWPTRIVIG